MASPVGSATTLLVEGIGEEDDHGSPGRVGRADLQIGSRHGGRLTVPRGPGPRARHLRREMKRKATAAVAAIGLTASETVRLAR